MTRPHTATSRCANCDHLDTYHSQRGCWHTLTITTTGRDLVCPCTLNTGSRHYQVGPPANPQGQPTREQ